MLETETLSGPVDYGRRNARSGGGFNVEMIQWRYCNLDWVEMAFIGIRFPAGRLGVAGGSMGALCLHRCDMHGPYVREDVFCDRIATFNRTAHDDGPTSAVPIILASSRNSFCRLHP